MYKNGFHRYLILQFTDKCLPIDSSTCNNDYSETTFPNYLDHPSASVANAFLTRAQTIVETGCYDFAQRFLCAVAIPKCIENSRIPPCRQMCEGVVSFDNLFNTIDNPFYQ